MFEHEALAARAATRFGKVSAPMASVDDLVVFKAIAGRSRDIDDAVTLLALYPHIAMARVRARVRTLALAAEAPELERGLEQIVAAGAAALPHRSQPGHSPSRPGGQGRVPQVVPLAEEAAALGDHVFTIGFPEVGDLGVDPKLTEGSISGERGLGLDFLLQASAHCSASPSTPRTCDGTMDLSTSSRPRCPRCGSAPRQKSADA
jgi:hypothetical protein